MASGGSKKWLPSHTHLLGGREDLIATALNGRNGGLCFDERHFCLQRIVQGIHRV